MSIVFVDISALAKRYLFETGASWVQSVTQPSAGNVLIIADLTLVEMSSLLARRVREGALSSTNGALLTNAFLLHADSQYLTVPLDRQVLAQARSLVVSHPLRALDAIQLASAQTAQATLGEAITFISSDRNLSAAAIAEGLPTDDPLAHP